jgi:hypothetical protein
MNARSRLLFAFGCLLLALAVALPRMVAISDTASGVLYGLAVGCLLGALLRSRLPDACDTATPALRRRYLREFVPPMLGYMVALWLSLTLLKRIDTEWLRALVALLPVAPIAFAMRAIMRYIRDADEMQRKIELEAVSIATALISLLYLAGGFLQLARVIDIASSDAMIWVFPLVCLSYGLAKIVVMRRYR